MLQNQPLVKGSLAANLRSLLPNYAVLELKGHQAASFLQGQMTADINLLHENTSIFTAFCNPKGRIRALAQLFSFKEVYYLALPRLLMPDLLATLANSGRFSRIELKALPWTLLSIQGSLAMGHLQHLGYPLEGPQKWQSDSFVVIHHQSPLSYYEIYGDGSEIQDLWNRLTDFEIVSADAWQIFKIRGGIPEIFPQTQFNYLPQPLGLVQLGAVSLTKGCYCGQEVIAKMAYRNAGKRKLYQGRLAKATAAPEPGSLIYDETHTEVGSLLLAAASPHSGYEVLLEALVENTGAVSLCCHTPAGMLTLTDLTLPAHMREQ